MSSVQPVSSSPQQNEFRAIQLPEISLETATYVLILGIGIALRLLNLGNIPLTALEANGALAALSIVERTGINLATQSQLLNSLQAVSFWAFGASDFVVRMWPAIAGAFIVFSPALFRDLLGRRTALIVSSLLAISPALIAASRTANGATLSLTAALLVVAMFRKWERTESRTSLVLAGVALGAGLASGHYFITIVFLGAAALALNAWFSGSDTKQFAGIVRGLQSEALVVFLATVGSFILFSTAGVFYPAGLTNAGSMLPTWLSGWFGGLELRPFLMVPVSLVLYGPLIGILGLASAWLAMQGDKFVQRLLITTGLALIYGVIYSARESVDVIWVLAPLSIAAARFLVSIFSGGWKEGDLEITIGQAAILFLLLSFAYLNLANLDWLFRSGGDQSTNIPLLLAAGVILLFGVTTALFATGWSVELATRASTMAIVIAALALALRAGWGVGQANAGDARELWAPKTISPNARLLVASIEDISLRHVGDTHDAEITVLGQPDGPLAWLLRDFTNVNWVSALGSQIDSPVVVTNADIANPTLGSTYLGQQFAFENSWDEQLSNPRAYVGYFLFRYAPTSNDHLVIWVREDVQLFREPA